MCKGVLNLSKKNKGKKSKSLRPIQNGTTIRINSFLGDTSGCGTIRVIYPYLYLNQYRHSKQNITIISHYDSMMNMDPNYYKNLPILQFQRSATQSQYMAFSHMKKNILDKTGTKTFYEIDDLLVDIPEWNFAHPYYITHKDSIVRFLSDMDCIVTSTEPLKKVYSKYNKNVKVIPNHLPKFIWGEIPEKELQLDKKPRILWAGSQNHFAKPDSKVPGGDFDDVLINFIKKTVDKYEWVFVGAIPNELRGEKGIEHHGWMNIFNYPHNLKALKVDLAIAPLLNCSFNDCKSNIKALEYTATGIPAIYSKSYPYKNMTMVTETQEEMISKIEETLLNPDLWKDIKDKDYQIVKENLWWEENENVEKYINTYLNFIGWRLPKNK